ncbi:hypothetical protein CEP88_03600 [Roseobacter denitrificans]|uniref:Uncharacterized protein n=1 Tax=Roseobacter denitrificans (strain ATCC 33942 / OCh 114) TaxID=375451 RepID=Q165Q3_ROSDO|nr:hypothetical protein [Roseobacter denitrificans]ABG32290.1 hypothetical protein RD1_2758 [Roseobacter denitrificans OCh 114]AVL51774.1 hypothetical protein CEP88_03600 [Roseobacter denitrificans]SFF79902.1 hypothetical protein SAMN05443635_102253 [Roseobacter denitrificans OCh 114]
MADGPHTVNSIVLGSQSGHFIPMVWFRILLLGGSLLAACAPMELYYQSGGSVARMQDNLLSCEVAALRDAPVASEIRRRPPVFVPPRRYCTGGHCYHRGGYFVDGQVYTVDVNARLRGDLEARCMRNKGYTPVEIPDCPARLAREISPTQTDVMPPLTPASCVIRDRSGMWQIVETAP